MILNKSTMRYYIGYPVSCQPYAYSMTWLYHMDWCDFVTYVLEDWFTSQMETFSALLAICAGNSPVSGEFPTQRPVTRSFDVLFVCPNKQLSIQSIDLSRHRAHYDFIVMWNVTHRLILE